ncbi:MAG: fimbrillin family protein [Bacteroidales bacterium]
MRKYIFFLGWISICFIGLMLFSCSQNEIELVDPKDGTTEQSGQNLVEFEMTDSTPETKLATPFGAKRYVTIYAYLHGSDVTSPPVQKRNYKSNPTGKLIPISAPMKLITGHYDFYAVSTNSLSDKTPLFTNGISAVLAQNTDYLWAKMNNISVHPGKISVPFAFLHECGEIIITVKETIFTFVHFIDGVYITVPGGDSRMTLANGEIGIAESLQKKLVSMNVTDNVCQIIMLPYKGELPLQVVFKLWINLHWEYKLYNTSIPLPGNELEAGKQYLYEAIVDESVFELHQKDTVSKSE